MPSEQVERRLDDILDNIERIRFHIGDADKAAFLADPTRRDAVERCLERIAESVRKIGPGYDARFPDVELPKLRQFGSVLRHDYDLIEPETIWNACTTRLPKLEAMCRTLLGH